jgi:two-component system, sensor histidine kinase
MQDQVDESIAPWDREDSASRNLVRLIAQSTNDGIWDWNLETDAVYYSPRWLELVGYLPGELPGHMDSFVNLLHPDDRENALRIGQEYLAGARPAFRTEFRLRHKDGSWRWILSRGIALRDGMNRAIRFAGTHTDIDDRIRTAQRLESMVADRTTDLRAARDRAELTAAATTKFLATVSHDIRQPLQAVALQIGSLKNEVSSPEGKRILRATERSLNSGMELLDFLLDYIKLDAGALKPQPTTVSVGSLFEVLSDAFALMAAQKGLDLTVVPTRLAVHSDSQLLGRILRNLVSNAVKYTDRGRILIGCRRHEDRVRIEVWDTGCGIPTESQRQIFWEFMQLREPGGPHGGLGLGLAIVDRLAKLLGHRVELCSWPGRGSVFAVEMPLISRTSVASGVVASMPASDHPLTSKLVAVIDDDAGVAEALSDLLRVWGATTVCASDSDELLRALAGRRPDAVVADRNLGNAIDGFEVLTQLESQLGGALPALILTGDYDVSDQTRANSAGRRVLHKPVGPDALLAALRSELALPT